MTLRFLGTPPPPNSPMGMWLNTVARHLGLADDDPTRIGAAIELIAERLPRYRLDQIAVRVSDGDDPVTTRWHDESSGDYQTAAKAATSPVDTAGRVFLAWGSYPDGSGSEFFGVAPTREGAYSHAGRVWIEDGADGYRAEIVEFGPDGKPVTPS